MRILVTILAVGMLGAGLVAMGQEYSHPGSLAQASETQNVYGAECYLPSPHNVWICSGGTPSMCSGCGCQLWGFVVMLESGAANMLEVTCAADPACVFADVDTSRFCSGFSDDQGGPKK